MFLKKPLGIAAVVIGVLTLMLLRDLVLSRTKKAKKTKTTNEPMPPTDASAVAGRHRVKSK